MKKVLVCIALLSVVLGIFLGAQVHRKRTEARQAAAHDELRLPSRSQYLMALADTLTAYQRDTLFRRYNLAGLFERTGQDGFIEPFPQRLEVVFKRVRRDAHQPALLHVEGLTRVREVISRLAGTIELGQVRPLFSGVYVASGPFRFRHFSGQDLAPVDWQGIAAIDFTTTANKPNLFCYEGAIRARSRYFAFEGTAGSSGMQKKPRLLWAAEFAPVANEVLGDFDIGGRMMEVNPKYARYGWNNYYRNDEWWVNSPKPKLHL